MPRINFNRALTKKIVGYVVQYGTGVIVYGIIRNNIAPERIDQKISAEVAAFALAGAAGLTATKYMHKFIDDICDITNEELAKAKTS